MKPESFDQKQDDMAIAISERELQELEVMSHTQDLLRKAMNKPKPNIAEALNKPIYPLNGTTIKVGYTTDWTGDTKYEVQIVGQLTDGRWLCCAAPELCHNVFYEPYWNHTATSGLFLRAEDQVTDVKNKVLEV